jgi:hypothetical protein
VKQVSVFLVASFLILLCAQAGAQTLIYSLCYSDTQASRQARYPNGALGASLHDKLAMLRRCRKDDIYSVSMTDGKRSLLFSDEESNLEINPTGPVFGDKTYGTGVLHEWRTTPVPGAYAEPRAIYEIHLDGSKQYRRIVETQANQPPAILNPQGTKAAVQTFVDSKYEVFIYDVPTWKVVHSWDLSKVMNAHCPSCTPDTYGWLADGARLFFNVDIVGDEDAEESRNDRPGIYLASEDGTDLGGISPEIGKFDLPGYIHPNFVTRRLIGQMHDGSYLFEDYAAKKGGHIANLEPFLVIAGDSKSPKEIPLHQTRIGSWFLSASGNYLAYVEERQVPNTRQSGTYGAEICRQEPKRSCSSLLRQILQRLPNPT